METKKINIGGVIIGGGNPIRVQSMTKTDTMDINSLIAEIKELEEAGCELIRVSFPSSDSVKLIPRIKKEIDIPLIADVHFNYKLAIKAIEAGVDKLRINPANIGTKSKVREILKVARERSVPIRIGVNSGSLGFSSGDRANEMVEFALDWVKFFEDNDFFDIVLSVKSSDVRTTIDAYRLLSRKTRYPLHIGVTEAGVSVDGIIRSCAGIVSLLNEGMGDTIRVSLTGSSKEEVEVAYKILWSLGLRKPRGFQIISCPTCARCKIDLQAIVNELEKSLKSLTPKNIKIAIMGCVVNGPGEAKDADIGIAGGKNSGLLFKKGKKLRKIKGTEIIEELIKEIKKL